MFIALYRRYTDKWICQKVNMLVPPYSWNTVNVGINQSINQSINQKGNKMKNKE